MDVLVPDTRSAAAAEVAEGLRARGHRVHACVQDPADEPCAEVSAGLCPLDAAPIDVAVAVGRPPDSQLADGAVCAVRRLLPLVLVGAPAEHPLERWTSARADVAGEVASTVAEVAQRPLAPHSDAARRALLHELRRHGSDSAVAAVSVHRRDGGLIVELRHDSVMSHTQAERLAAQVARAVRRHDRWARDIEVTVSVRDEVLAPST